MLIEVPLSYLSRFPAGTDLEIVVWHQNNPRGSQPPGLDTLSAYYVRRPLTQFEVDAPRAARRVTFPLQPAGVTTEGYWPNGDHYYVELRFANGNNVLSLDVLGLAGRMNVGESANSSMTYLRSRPEVAPNSAGEYMFYFRRQNQPPSTEHLGGITLRRVPPPFRDDAIPTDK
jgi:hypothetical protein